MRKVKIAPSILSADFANLGAEVKKAEKGGADGIHFDVMDGNFVPNISIGAPVLRSLRPCTSLFIDVHLMINNPAQYYRDFIAAGADLICFHYEAVEEKDIINLIRAIKESGARAGLSVKPHTPASVLKPYLKELDLVLVMAVEPGFGGQKFMPDSLEKVRYLRTEIDRNNYRCLIEIDGGMNDVTARLARDSGVDIIVAGSYVFKGDVISRIQKLR